MLNFPWLCWIVRWYSMENKGKGCFDRKTDHSFRRIGKYSCKLSQPILRNPSKSWIQTFHGRVVPAIGGDDGPRHTLTVPLLPSWNIGGRPWLQPPLDLLRPYPKRKSWPWGNQSLGYALPHIRCTLKTLKMSMSGTHLPRYNSPSCESMCSQPNSDRPSIFKGLDPRKQQFWWGRLWFINKFGWCSPKCSGIKTQIFKPKWYLFTTTYLSLAESLLVAMTVWDTCHTSDTCGASHVFLS